MKKIFLTAIAAMAASAAVAAPVSLDRAKVTATAFMQSTEGRTVTVKNLVTSNDSYYIFNLNPGGWVIVSADDTSSPVIGYNPTGSLSWHMLPDNMRGMLKNYSEGVQEIKRLPGVKQHAKWARLSSVKRMASRADGGTIDNLIQVNWNQGDPYNKYCPGTGSSKAVVGCVAVAMSQAMSVQKWPLQPQGEMTYGAQNYGQISINYDAEKPYDWEAILKGSNRMDEVARFLYHAGVSVRMMYGAEGSGAYTHQVPEALSTIFAYDSKEVKYYDHQSYVKSYGQNAWEDMILNELNAGRAVIYCGNDGSYGHCFNVDGYNGSRMFHLNWGWGGIGDGYFLLTNLNDANMGISYTKGHGAVIGVGSPNQVLKSIRLSDQIIDENLPTGSVVGQITVNDAAPERTYKLTVTGAWNSTLGEWEDVPFTIDGDLLVTTKPLTATDKPVEIRILVEDSASKTRLSSSYNITICKLRTIGEATSMHVDRASGNVTVRTRNGVGYSLETAEGVVVSADNALKVPSISFNLKDLSAGSNKLTLSAGGSSKVITIKK